MFHSPAAIPHPSFPIKIATASRKSASAPANSPPQPQTRELAATILTPATRNCASNTGIAIPRNNGNAQSRPRRRSQSPSATRDQHSRAWSPPPSRQTPPPNAQSSPHFPDPAPQPSQPQAAPQRETLHHPQPPRATHPQIATNGCRNKAATPCGVSVPATAQTIYPSSATRATAESPPRSRQPHAKSAPARAPRLAHQQRLGLEPRPQRILHQLRPLHRQRISPSAAPSRAAPREISSATYSRGW